MSWQKLSLNLSASLVEILSDMLHEAGALAVTLESTATEELFEPPPNATPLWAHTTLHALFETSDDLAKLIPLLAIAVYPSTFSYQVSLVANQDWQKNCRDIFQPLCFANKLWVCPSWSDLPNDGKPYVTLDPGLAFGTGSHPTTQLCLTWLAKHIKGGEYVIDYGCGSGILSLAALKLGAKKVWAVDRDSQAIEATLENVKRNGVQSSAIEAMLPENLPSIQANILIANILANPLIMLAPVFADLLQSSGEIAISGLLKEQASSVSQAYKECFDLLEPTFQEEWALLEGVKSLK